MADIDLRALALEVVTAVCEDGAYYHSVIRQASDKYSYLEREKKSFFVRVSAGTIEKLQTIDAVISACSKTNPSAMKPFIRNLLRISVCQIMFMDSVPDSAAINEAVKLCRRRHFDGLCGFVNAVLRKIASTHGSIVLTDARRYCVNEELYGLLRSQYPDRYRYILDSFNSDTHETFIRLNASRRPQALPGGLREVSHEIGVYAVKGSLSELKGFEEGIFTVQNLAACLPVYLADVRPYQKVLDLCAAPGGKSIQAADMMGDTGEVTSCDISQARSLMIDENIKRCGFNNIKTIINDASIYNKAFERAFDVVLCDVPCSGIGTIADKPDIRNRFSQAAASQAAALSRRILENAHRYVRPGGKLVFSTCTLNREENEDAVEYLKSVCELTPVDVRDRLPACITEYEAGDGITIYPMAGVCAGFYAAVLEIKG